MRYNLNSTELFALAYLALTVLPLFAVVRIDKMGGFWVKAGLFYACMFASGIGLMLLIGHIALCVDIKNYTGQWP